MSGGKSLVSVIVLNWNGKRFLKDCLSSLGKQTYGKLEVIFVDNASTDGSVEYVKKSFPKVKVIVNSENLGFAEGNNVGIRKAGGEYIILMNTDTRADENWVSQLVKAAESGEKIGMCASKEMDFEREGILGSTGVFLTKDVVGVNRACGARDEGQFDEVEEVFSAHGSSMLVKKKMLDDVGLLDADFFMSNEETDLAWRARLRGWKCVYAPKAVIYHVGSGSCKHLTDLVIYHLERNRLYLIMKNMGLSSILIYSPHLVVYELLAILHSILGLSAVRLKARVDALLSLPKMLAKRRRIQEGRVTSESEVRRLLKNPDYVRQAGYVLGSTVRKVRKVVGLGGS